MSAELSDFVVGAAFNLVSAFIIVRFVYYPSSKDRTYVFTFLAFNSTIYFLIGLLTSIELSVGAGFGLFAIFSVIRYRTEEMPIREMTYLFIIIALPVINSVLANGDDLARVLIANGTIITLLWILEHQWGFTFDTHRKISYDNLPLTHPTRREALIADLRERTGLDVRRVEVGRLDLIRDTAELTVYYEPGPRAP